MTRHGRLASLDALRANRHPDAGSDAALVEGLLDVVQRARLEADLPHGAPRTVQMIWFVERATVRASKQPAEDVPLPPKKRAATEHRGATSA